jgi:hypothetical protein
MKTQILNFAKTHKIAFALGALVLLCISISFLRESAHRRAHEFEISALKTENAKLKTELSQSALKVSELETERAAEDLRRETFIEPAREIARAQSKQLDAPLARARKNYEKATLSQTRFDVVRSIQPGDLFLANCRELALALNAIITDCPEPDRRAPGDGQPGQPSAN